MRLRKALAHQPLELQALAAASDGEDAAAGILGSGDGAVGPIGVGVDDGRAVLGQQLGEEAQLGGEVGLDGRMIIEVVASKIGEGGGLEAHAVEAVLVEAVGGRLEGKVGDALDRQLGERLVQRDRVGRRQRAVDGLIALDQADGAERGRPCAPARRRPGG